MLPREERPQLSSRDIVIDQALDAIRGCFQPFPRGVSQRFGGFELRNLSATLSMLSKKVENLDSPLAYYARASSEALREFLNSDAYKSLFIKGSFLENTSYLNGHLGGRIDDILAIRPPTGSYSSALSSFRELWAAVSTLTEIHRDWAAFRDALASGLEQTGSALAKKSDYPELGHSITEGILPPGAGEEYQLNSWTGVLSDLKSMERLVEWLARLFEHIGWQFDTICSLSASVIPVVTLLASKVNSKWIACDNWSRNFTRRPEKEERILLFDTVTETGEHFIDVGKRVLEITGTPVVGCFCLVRNDLLGDEKRRRAAELGPVSKLMYLYATSELYAVWRARQGRVEPADEQGEGGDDIGGFSRDVAWLHSNHEELRKRYPDHYVAAFREQFVNADRDAAALLARLRERYPSYWHLIAIRYVAAKDLHIAV